MRDVIFRGKTFDYGEWVYGCLHKKRKILSEKRYIDSIDTVAGIFCCQPIRVSPETIGQYTGLKDKHGANIFEGDIISSGEGLMTVVWVERYASFGLQKKGWTFVHYFGEAVEASDIEVVGNVFDNSELLEEK